MTTTKYDIVIFGATSFVGQILVDYMMQEYGAGSQLKWAIAGRSQEKLDEVKVKYNAQEIDLILADAANEAELTNMVNQTRVIVSTVGPYALYGEPLVKVCVETGTDYCDLTGEIQWYKRMVDRYEKSAQKTGARIVHCSGFDSIPSDLGVLFLQDKAKDVFGETCQKVKMRVANLKGGASGGTIASMVNIAKEAAKDSNLRKELKNPYSICPENHGFKSRQDNVSTAEFDEEFDCWVGPFVMGVVNTRVVHRTNALLNNGYHSNFSYDEAMMMGKGRKGKSRARNMAWGLNIFMLLAAIKPSRWLLERFILLKPGQGPTEEEQLKGYFKMQFIGVTESGKKIKTQVTGDRDPGYGSTAKMLAQAAVRLSEVSKSEKAGGFWTPASIYGEPLIHKLIEHSGLSFEVLESK